MLSTTLKRYVRDAGRALSVAPVEVVIGVAVAALFSWTLEHSDAERAFAEMLILAALVGLGAWAATLAASLAAVRPPVRWAITLAVTVAVVLYDVVALDVERIAEVWRAGLLLAAAALALLLPPLAIRHAADRELLFRAHALRLMTRIAGVALYGAALFAGLALAIAAVDSLFDLDLDEKIYQHVWGWIAFALVPWIIVGGTAEITASPAPPGDAARVTRRFATYLLLPLLVIYFGILYAYVVRILVTLELPKNLVSPLVLAAGLIGAAAAVLFARDERAPIAVRWAPPLFLPLSLLGFWALWLRVDQYGWTENRYVRLALLFALALLAAAATVRLWRGRPLTTAAVPLLLIAVLLLSAFGPWSAMAVSRRSQEARLAAALERIAPVRGPDRGQVSVSRDDCTAIVSVSMYLSEHFGPESVQRVTGLGGVERGDDVARRLRLSTVPADRDGAAARAPDGIPTALLGTGALHEIQLVWESERGAKARWGEEYESVIVSIDGVSGVADLRPLVRALELQRSDRQVPCGGVPRRGHPSRERTLSAGEAALPLAVSGGTRVGTLLVQRVSAGVRTPGASRPAPDPPADAPWKLTGLEGLVVWFE